MRKIFRYFILAVFFIACGSEISSAQNSSGTQVNQIEVNKITEVAVAFMKAYSKNDLATIDSLSSGSVRNTVRESGWVNWQSKKNLVFDGVRNQVAVNHGNSIGTRITFYIRGKDLDMGEVIKPISFDFHLAKQNGKWKIFYIAGSIRNFVDDLLYAQNDDSVLNIVKEEKAFLNSDEINGILSELKQSYSKDQQKLIKIFEIIASQVEQSKYKNTVLYEQGWLLYPENLAQAEKNFLESISLSQTVGDDLLNAQSLISLGSIYLKKEMEAEAAQMFDKGLNVFLGKSNLVNTQLTWLRFVGNFYFNEGQYEKARNYYIQGEKIAEKSNHTPWLAVFIEDLGDCDLYAGKYLETLQQYQKLTIILERPENKEGFLHGNKRINLPTVYATIAYTLEKLDRVSEAQSLFEKSCDLAYAKNSAQDLKYPCNSVIEYYFRDNSNQKAVETFNKLSEKLFELKAESELIDHLRDFIFILAIEKGRHNQSEKIAEYWSEKISPEKRKDIYQIQMGLYMTNYKWSLVQSICQKIIDSEYSTAKDKLMATIGMVTAYGSRFQKEETVKWLNKGEIFAKETNEKESLVLITMFRIMLTLEEDNSSQNINQLQKIIEENSGNDLLVGFANYWLGISYLSLVEDDYKANSESAKKGIETLQKSLEIYNRPQNKEFRTFNASVYSTIALIYKETGDLQLALENIKKAKEIAAETETYFMQWQLELFEAEIQTALGNFVKANEIFKNGLEGLNTQSKYVGGGIRGQLNFNAAYQSFYQSAVKAELKTNNIDNAVAKVDLAKGRMLRELNQKDNKPDWVFADAVPKGVVKITIIKNSNVEDKTLPSNSNTSIEQVNKQIKLLKLDNETAILNYFVDEDNIHLFILASEAKTTLQEVSNKREPSWRHYTIKYDYLVKNKVKRFQNLLRNKNAAFKQTAKELYDLLLKPAEKQISGKSTLIILPNSFLWQMPFQALIAKDSANPNNTKQEKFVIEKFAVQYAFSLSHLIESERRKKNRADQQSKVGIKNVLAIGNSTFSGQVITLKSVPEVSSFFADKPQKIESITQNGIVPKLIPERQVKLQSLPGAAIEAKNLLKIYGIDTTDGWLDKNATKNKFIEKAFSYKIIHIATHGILDDENPLNSSLVFSNSISNGQNTIAGKTRKPITIKQTSNPSHYGEEHLLTAQEILSELRLNADLVVLSACDTANGEVSDGEGLIGLTWAFLGVGATNVVASQWIVDDNKTPELMKEFHQQLQDKKQKNSIPVALQKSVKVLLQNPYYYHPYYWAGFVSVGTP